MVFIRTAVYALLALATQVVAAPAPIGPASASCKVSPDIKRDSCALVNGNNVVVTTPLGPASGTVDNNAYRFTVRYGSAPRWGSSTAASTWQLPNGLTDPSGSPLACPQDTMDSSQYSEDCLSIILYVPKSAPTGNFPTLLWIHGGSFTYGSATAPGLDGSNLAATTNSIVAFVQYRLGGLGFVAPNGASNLGVKDVVTAMTFLNRVLPSFGGAAGQITVAGQSSGGTLIRALLATPLASSLFKSAVLHSDPMDYGLFKPSTQSALNNDFQSNLGCASGDSNCLNNLSLDDIMNAADTTAGNAASLDPAASGSEWFRPVVDGSYITSPLDSTAAFPAQTKTIIVTNVADEAMAVIYGAYTSPVSASDYQSAVGYSYSQSSTNAIMSSSFYSVPSGMATQVNADARPLLEVLGTDGIWRCPTWTFARAWTAAGGKVYVGEFVVGATYPGNEAVSECTTNGSVCHQDDIEILFGTAPSPSSSQTKAIAETQARWGAFMKTGNPNAPGFSTWNLATSSNVNAVQIGNGNAASVPVAGCTTDFWGTKVPYDYQVYDI